MHEHTEPKKCKHELKYCVKCDTVYCEKCHEEWKKYTSSIPDYMKEIDKWWKKREIDDPKPYWNGDIVLCKHAEDL